MLLCKALYYEECKSSKKFSAAKNYPIELDILDKFPLFHICILIKAVEIACQINAFQNVPFHPDCSDCSLHTLRFLASFSRRLNKVSNSGAGKNCTRGAEYLQTIRRSAFREAVGDMTGRGDYGLPPTEAPRPSQRTTWYTEGLKGVYSIGPTLS